MTLHERMLAQGDGKKAHVPVRSCVICRTRCSKQELNRYVCRPQSSDGGDVEAQRLILDPEQSKPGRGFYLCAEPQCQSKFLQYQGWRRKCKGVVSA